MDPRAQLSVVQLKTYHYTTKYLHYHYTTKEIQRPNLFWTCLVMLWDGKRGKSGVLRKILHKFTSIFSFHVETMMLFCFYNIKIQNKLLLNWVVVYCNLGGWYWEKFKDNCIHLYVLSINKEELLVKIYIIWLFVAFSKARYRVIKMDMQNFR